MLQFISTFVLSSLLLTSGICSENEIGDDMEWPNFFSPKVSILREKESKHLKKLQATQNKTFLDEDLFDYTLKGGLRGTLVLLNQTAALNDLPKDSQEILKKVLQQDEKFFANISKKLKLGETTEDGMRLQTPLTHRAHSSTMGKYGALISFFIGEKLQNILYYGNWCGRGGRSAPVDNIDSCCLEHQKCYGKSIRRCPDIWKKPYSSMYAWTQLENEPVCVRSESTCINRVCNCDREANLCFKYFVENPNKIPLKVTKHASED